MTSTVILLAGPSGSGKSTLGARLGLPVLRLDDFYREGHDPALPRDAAGRVDWDLPGSWHAPDALAAVVSLATTGSADVPVYEIGADRRVGTRRVELAGAPVFVAEGLFADRIVEGCAAAGVLAGAIVLDPSAGRTALRRFSRDVAESRKSVPVLLRRGLRLWREHAAVVRRGERAGMRRCTPEEAVRVVAGAGVLANA
ncbi:uridine kinase [Actinokineospora sp. PR83]|uniref:uridine kinase family protein n=1 Tax=Actinokineospora sp. PR83 TaxID=2884908 RepID=UPI001F3D861E|nr:uridine kinase [Actinokineospora sp. PR83]MCG8917775.1 uridine kinase [Actinokineospora sp. PR83]